MIQEELIDDKDFFERIVSLMEELKAQVAPAPLEERLEALELYGAMDEVDFESQAKNDPANIERLRALGYVGSSDEE